MHESLFKRQGDEGATAIEYAILASMVAAVIATVVFSVGLQTIDHFTRLVTAF